MLHPTLNALVERNLLLCVGPRNSRDASGGTPKR